MEGKEEIYFGKATSVRVTERTDGTVKFKLYCGCSCPQKIEMNDHDFKKWLDEKGFKAA